MELFFHFTNTDSTALNQRKIAPRSLFWQDVAAEQTLAEIRRSDLEVWLPSSTTLASMCI
jgi:hypothetical protein